MNFIYLTSAMVDIRVLFFVGEIFLRKHFLSSTYKNLKLAEYSMY